MLHCAQRSTIASAALLVFSLLFAAPASATVIFEWTLSTGSPSTGHMEITTAAFNARTVAIGDVIDFEFVTNGTTYTEAGFSLFDVDIATDGSRLEGVRIFVDSGPLTARISDIDVDGIWNWVVVGESGTGTGEWLMVIPEPGTASLVLLGMLAIGARRRSS